MEEGEAERGKWVYSKCGRKERRTEKSITEGDDLWIISLLSQHRLIHTHCGRESVHERDNK